MTDDTGEPLDKERSSKLLKSLPLYSHPPKAAIGVDQSVVNHSVETLSPPPNETTEAALTRSDAVVLDTNVVLDWLLFRDLGCTALAARLEAQQLRWCATAAMRAELASVLPRPQLQQWHQEGEHVLTAFDQRAVLLPEATTSAAVVGLRCRDVDDQKFIDLACAIGARWLLTRDRALLDLAKAARKHGVEVLRPAAWAQRHGGGTESSTPG